MSISQSGERQKLPLHHLSEMLEFGSCLQCLCRSLQGGTSMKGSVMRQSYLPKLDSMSPAVTPLAATKAAVPPLLPASTLSHNVY